MSEWIILAVIIIVPIGMYVIPRVCLPRDWEHESINEWRRDQWQDEKETIRKNHGIW